MPSTPHSRPCWRSTDRDVDGSRSAGGGDAAHVEVGYAQCRSGRTRELVAPLTAERRHAHACLREPPQQVDRTLVEAEVVDGAGDLAVLDQVDAVAGEAGEEERLRVDLADVPQTGQEQAVFDIGNEFFG